MLPFSEKYPERSSSGCMFFQVQSVVVKWLADVTHQQFQDTCHLRRKPNKGILAE